MCGIAGVIKVHDPKDGPPPPHLEAIPESWLDILDDSIKHRGPDGQGRFRDRATRDDGTIVDVALVHRRLSIIDHDGGAQPMVHDGDRLRPDLTYQPGDTPIIASEIEPNKPLIAVAFNGCIYNHRELRKELEAAGHVFETDHSDTEVLLHSWRSWEEEVKNTGATRWLNGMYACIFWDRGSGQCSTFRDPFGQKPLYIDLAIDLKTRVFSSSFSAFPRLPLGTMQDPNTEADFEPSIPRAVFTGPWLRLGWEDLHGSEKWFKNAHPACDIPSNVVDPIEPSHFGVIAWMNRIGKLPALNADTTEELLRNAVRRRLEADVPLGCFLSGGIDSSLISKFALDEAGSLETFTVRMPSIEYDESAASQEIANHLGTKHHILECQANPAEDLIELIEQLGLPFGDSSLLPTYWVSEAASQNVKVALSGDGGDELFYGYERHRVSDILESSPSFLKWFPTSLLSERDPKSKYTKLARLIRLMRVTPVSFCTELAAIFSLHDYKKLNANSKPDKWAIATRDGLDFVIDRIPDPRGWDILNYLTGDLLRKTDTASMAVALEVRCPFLDPDLAQAALATPKDILMPNGERKGLLKQVARKYLPDHIVDRPKQGFAIPIGEWFRSDYGDMRQLLLDHLRSSDPFPELAEAGVNINMKFVEQMIREHDAAGEKSINPWHGRDHSQRLYMLLVLSIWCKWLQRIRSSNSM
ncbi:MAG: asparagine synthase (glutamine-hydrolyzing) [Phycisphaerales bacterium]|nr:asparagine synthase (glutamine-hydrolyzing) [Phycisphaerales bacterium]